MLILNVHCKLNNIISNYTKLYLFYLIFIIFKIINCLMLHESVFKQLQAFTDKPC